MKIIVFILRNMKKNIAIGLLFLSSFAFSQEKIPFVDTEEIINKIRESAQIQDYDKAIEYVDLINKNDSMYLSLLTSKSYYLMGQKKYEAALAVIDIGLNAESKEPKLYFYINKGVALSSLERYTEALALYEKGLAMYPKNYLLWYNKGYILEQLNKIEEAVKAYQTSITLNPYYKKAHLQLGNLCYKQQLMAQALMCFNLYLLLEPDTEDAFNVLKSLNSVVASTNSNIKNEALSISKDDSSFESIDMVLNNRIPLNKDYIVDNPITVSLTKQNHALIEQLADHKGNGGFWDQKYIPIFKWIKQENLFDAFVYTISFTIKNEEYKKIINKNVEVVQKFVAAFKDKWAETMQNNLVTINGKTKKVFYNYSGNYVSGIGEFDGEKPQGNWNFYNQYGQQVSKGGFNSEGKRQGSWTWYHPNGLVSETATYNNGKLEGQNHLFHDNGLPYIEANFINDELHGLYKLYNAYGALEQKKYFKNGKLEGKYIAYFNVGEDFPEFDTDYKNDSIYSTLKEFYAGGNIFKESIYRKGILVQEKSYHFNDKLHSETNYRNSQPHGLYRSYYTNGQLAETGQNANGANEGNWKTYYRNGSLESEYGYKDGMLSGDYKYYDVDGKLHYLYEYRKGEIIAYTFYDKAGGILKEGRKKGGEFVYEGYSPDGNVTSRGLYDVSGGRIGIWKYYSVNGVLSNTGNFVQGELHGEYIDYFDSGEKKTFSTYVNGKQEGYYAEYYKNGVIKTQGYFKDNAQYGLWKTYYINKEIESELYYHKGKVHGESIFYSVSGKKASSVFFEYDRPIKYILYAPDGKVLDKNSIVRKEKKYKFTTRHYNNKVFKDFSYQYGKRHGPYIEYDFNGNKVQVGEFLGDDKNGEWIDYYESGKIKSKSNFITGNLNGEYVEYYENGQIKTTETYEYGTQIGDDISYYENGNISLKFHVDYGAKHGKQTFFDKQGRVQLIRFYERGRLIGYSYLDEKGVEKPMIPLKNESGKVIAYYQNGKKSKEMEFFNGKLVNDYKEYYFNGTLANKILFDEGEYHKNYIDYYENGTIKEDTQYVHGLRHGYKKTYYKNGKLKKEENFIHNTKIGVSKMYNDKGDLVKEITYFNGRIFNEKSY